MDNQQDQAGPMPGDDVRVQNAGTTTGSTGLGNDATVSGGGARKSGSARGGAQDASEPQASGNDQSNQQSGDQGQDDGQMADKLLNTAIESGRKWIENSGVLNNVNQLPQNVKEWGTRAAGRVGDLTTTQKIVGGALLAVGIGLLVTRKGKAGKSSKSDSRYGRQGGSYGRSGYQSTDALGSRRSSYGSSSSDSGSAYGNSGSSYRSGSSTGAGSSTSSNAASGGDFSPRTSESSYRSKNDDFRNIE